MNELVRGVALPLSDPGKPVSATPSDGNLSGFGRRKLLLAGLLLGLGAVAGFMLQPLIMPSIAELSFTGVKPEAPQGQPVTGTGLDVVALGRLVPKGGALAVALPSGAGDARIAQLMVDEGDTVKAGDTIAELDNIPMLLAAKSSAVSNLAAQQAALDQVRMSTLANLAEARANRSAAAATLTLASQELERQTRLAASNTTTQVLLEQARSNAIKAQAELDRTAALVDRFSGAETAVQSDIVLAARNVDLARANLAKANEDLASGRVVAPVPGVVLAVNARVGEKPADTGVVVIGDVAQMTAELEVYQTEVKNVALGRTVTISAQALPAALTGKVEQIGQIVGRQSVMATEPAANADARVVKVTVLLDPVSSANARAYTNLEVVGRIRTSAE